ncbi:hypothetical protein LguiA_007905 [Lonicera macranthoides]
MDEMMCGQRGRRELAMLGDKMEKFTSMVEGLIRFPKSGEANGQYRPTTPSSVTPNNPSSDKDIDFLIIDTFFFVLIFKT